MLQFMAQMKKDTKQVGQTEYEWNYIFQERYNNNKEMFIKKNYQMLFILTSFYK